MCHGLKVWSIYVVTWDHIQIHTFTYHIFSRDTQLYKRLCPSFGPLVCQSVSPSISTSWKVGIVGSAHIRPYPPIRNWWPCIQPCFLYHVNWHDLRKIFIFITDTWRFLELTLSFQRRPFQQHLMEPGMCVCDCVCGLRWPGQSAWKKCFSYAKILSNEP